MTEKTCFHIEDNPHNKMLALRALRLASVANSVDVARDGQQALDYLFRAGDYANRAGPDLRCCRWSS